MSTRPPAFEKLYKILKLEADTGYRDKAMIGGLSQFAARWQQEAGGGDTVQRIAALLRSYGELKPVDPRRVAINQIVQLMGYPSAIKPDPTAAAQPPIAPEAAPRADVPSADRRRGRPPAAAAPIEPKKIDPAPAPIETKPAPIKPPIAEPKPPRHARTRTSSAA